jgi:RIO kinase 1
VSDSETLADSVVEETLDDLPTLDDSTRLPGTPMEGLPWWLTEKTKKKRAKGRDERTPGHVFYPALASFFSDGWIKDVRMLVKSGKEATVYCCEALPSTGYALIAAKVFRPVGVKHRRNPQSAYEEAELRHSFEKKVKVRTFRWDARYQEGRNNIQDARLRRAYENRSRTGRGVQDSFWAQHEFETLRRLHAAGADVPRPLALAGSALLMEYVGDEREAAPTLQQAQLPREEAQGLFERVVENIGLWLDCGYVHADLSSFNLLYWAPRVVAIDFPQAVDAHANPHAFEFLLRDVGNVCKHFGRYGISVDAETLAWDLWEGKRQPGRSAGGWHSGEGAAVRGEAGG